MSSSAGISLVLYHRVCALVLKEVHSAVRDGRRLGFSGNVSVSAVLFNACARVSVPKKSIMFRASVRSRRTKLSGTDSVSAVCVSTVTYI